MMWFFVATISFVSCGDDCVIPFRPQDHRIYIMTPSQEACDQIKILNPALQGECWAKPIAGK